jgi:ring-1,2-phenylacetyl-CoA epoxidase subunit PaaE
VALSLPGSADPVRRSYSICTPAGSEELTVAVKRTPGGAFSPHVHDRLASGDELDVLTPSGRFSPPIEPAQAKAYAGVAAGSGIAPVLSVLATVLEVEPASSFTLLYGNRTTASTMFLERLLDLKNLYPGRFAFYPVFSREPQEVELMNGRIDGDKLALFLDTLLAGQGFDEWLLCGPLPMVEELRSLLLDRGVAPACVHRELFHVSLLAQAARPRAGVAPGSAGISTVTVVLDGRSTSFPLAPDGPRILDAALSLRPEVPYACRAGVCGTCRARLLEGRVEMVGGHALEPDEIEAGFVLACQSHPRSPRVTLAFDA